MSLHLSKYKKKNVFNVLSNSVFSICCSQLFQIQQKIFINYYEIILRILYAALKENIPENFRQRVLFNYDNAFERSGEYITGIVNKYWCKMLSCLHFHLDIVPLDFFKIKFKKKSFHLEKNIKNFVLQFHILWNR